MLCSASASWVLSNFVFLHIPLPLTLLAFLSAAPCFWGSLLGNRSWVGGTWTQSCFSLVLACLHDAYFPRCLALNFLFRTLNFPSLFSFKYSIPGRNQTFVLHHTSGNMFFFSVQMWILVRIPVSHIDFATTSGNSLCTSCDVPWVIFQSYILFLLLLFDNSWVDDGKFPKDNVHSYFDSTKVP